MRLSNFGAVRLPLLAAAVLALFACPVSAQIVERSQTWDNLIATHPCNAGLNGRHTILTDAQSSSSIGGGGGSVRVFVECDGVDTWSIVSIGGGASGPADALAPAVVIEGTTADAFEGNFTFADPTADWTCAWSATGQVSCPLGTSLLPTYSFGADTNSGFWSSSGDVIGLSLGGTLRYEWYTDGMQFYNGVGIIGLGNSGNTIIGMVQPVEANTAGSGTPNVLLAGETRKILTNEGATAANYHALPLAASGLSFTFCVQDADGMRVVANTDDTIRVIDKVTAAAGYVESTTIGSCVSLLAINAVEWFSTSINGVFTDGTFTYDSTSLTTP